MRTSLLRLALIFAIAISLLIPLGNAFAQKPDGKKLIETFFDNLYVKTDEKSMISIRLVNKQGMERKRKLVMYTKKKPDGTTSALIKFVAPQEMAGTALLSVENPKRDSDQWLYLPAFKKIKRIAGADKEDSFMGTDFTFEDIEKENPNNYNYKTLKKETVEGEECWAIEGTPKKGHKSGYSKRILWISPKINFAYKIEYYDKKGNLQKTQYPSEFKQQAGRWLPSKTKIVDHQKEHKTFLNVEKRVIGQGIPDKVFTQRYLTRP